jgi:hypothetical protein
MQDMTIGEIAIRPMRDDGKFEITGTRDAIRDLVNEFGAFEDFHREPGRIEAPAHIVGDVVRHMILMHHAEASEDGE